MKPRAHRECAQSRLARNAALLFSVLLAGTPVAAATAPRTAVSLGGEWLCQTNGAPPNAWKRVQLPASLEAHAGVEFDGVVVYRRTLPRLPLTPHERLLLHFQAAATETTVWLDGHRLGTHLGGWTPFRFDITDLVRDAAAPLELQVEVDEKVGHNTQGFLPVVQPHFGGLWQDIQLLRVPETYLDDLVVFARGNPATSRLELQFPVVGSAAAAVSAVHVRWRLRGQTRWTSTTTPATAVAPIPASTAGRPFVAEIPVTAPRLWSPQQPALYEIALALPPVAGAQPDVVHLRAAFRSITTRGRELLLNGEPLQVRGLLNWGYYPASERGPASPATTGLACADLSPNPPETLFRQDLALARERGFNLMKFCLWIPPRRYLELADETGFLTWMEYPTWHPQLTPQHWDELRREFLEFFRYDRPHPSVILRSLTCETGASADLDVIRSLYNLCHATIPGALVEDDSSWIGWNRVNDFWDDHPYGNNHTWPATLGQLNTFISTNVDKPLLLGESMAADTWVPPARYPTHDVPAPYWFPAALPDQLRWQERLAARAGPATFAALETDSLHYALLMRKYQAETYRREVPAGGYVMSVLRDFPVASMGLLDYRGQPKWSPDDWAWQRDTTLLLQTDQDARSFAAGTEFRATLRASHYGSIPLERGRLGVRLLEEHSGTVLHESTFAEIAAEPGALTVPLFLRCTLPAAEAPRRVRLEAALTAPGTQARNAWPLWIVPHPQPDPATRLHSSLTNPLVRACFPKAPPWASASTPTQQIVVAARFDAPLLDWLDRGGRVLLLPDGGSGSLPLAEHWFLRGAPVIPTHPLTLPRPSQPAPIPRDLFVELQHFDLADRVLLNPDYLEASDPILLLWDTHDLREVKTHALVFESRVGQGRLLVSALRHGGAGNAAGYWLAQLLVEHLRQGEPPRQALALDRLRRHLQP